MLIESKEGKRKERNKGRKQGEREGRRGDEKVKQGPKGTGRKEGREGGREGRKEGNRMHPPSVFCSMYFINQWFSQCNSLLAAKPSPKCLLAKQNVGSYSRLTKS